MVTLAFVMVRTVRLKGTFSACNKESSLRTNPAGSTANDRSESAANSIDCAREPLLKEHIIFSSVSTITTLVQLRVAFGTDICTCLMMDPVVDSVFSTTSDVVLALV